MISVKYAINGKEVSKEELFSSINPNRIYQQGLSLITKAVVDRIEVIKCPVHNEHASITFLGLEGTQLKFDIGSCCDVLRAMCVESIGAQP
jgi:hypothetical protein